jgi:hypothetical protein
VAWYICRDTAGIIMVKFSKQLEAAMVPEWKRMYVNYKELKRLVHRIQQERLAEINNSQRSSSMSSWSNIGSNLGSLGEKLRRSSSTGISICGSSSEIIGVRLISLNLIPCSGSLIVALIPMNPSSRIAGYTRKVPLLH